MPDRNKYLDPDDNQKAETSQAEQAAKFAAENKQAIFWAPASQFQIANFQKEIKQYGSMTQIERPIRFSENRYVTSVKEEIEFIESSLSFIGGSVKRCKTIEEANILTSQVKAMKGVKTVNVQDVSSTVIQDKVV